MVLLYLLFFSFLDFLDRQRGLIRCNFHRRVEYLLPHLDSVRVGVGSNDGGGGCWSYEEKHFLPETCVISPYPA